MPFYRVHDARYTVYWNVTTKEEFDTMKAEIEEREKALQALETATIDFVQPGQQQPETEHNFKSMDSENGVHQDRHWRHARGWFSYELKDSDKEGCHIENYLLWSGWWPQFRYFDEWEAAGYSQS